MGKPLQLGDAVEKALSAVGVTKERVEQWAGGGCGCAKRQQWLNDWGARYLGLGGEPDPAERERLRLELERKLPPGA